MTILDKNRQKLEITGVIFDLDGTLLDSMPFWETVGTRFVEKHGIAATEEMQRRVKTMTLMESAYYFRDELGIAQQPEDICKEIIALITEDYRSNAPLKDGVREVLDDFKRRGIPMCIATATDEKLVRMAVQRLGIEQDFCEIATCMGWNTSKNLPYIFEECARRMGSQPAQTAVFEDSLHSIRTAASAGFPVIAVYDRSAAGEREEIQKLCCRYLPDWKALETE